MVSSRADARDLAVGLGLHEQSQDPSPSARLRMTRVGTTHWLSRHPEQSSVVLEEKIVAASVTGRQLQLHLFHRACRNPPTLIIRQRRVIPVTALLQNHNFASSWKGQNASCTIDGRNSGFGVFRSHNCQALPVRSVFQSVGSKPANRGQKHTDYRPQHAPRPQDQKNNREPEKNRGHNREKTSRAKI